MLHFRHIFKPQNVVCNIFSELTLKAFPLFFSERNLLKLLPKNLVRKLKTEPYFVDKLCAEDTFSGKYVVKLKTETKLCVTIRTLPINVALSFFKFRKYYAAHNSGLKNMAGFGNF